MPISRWTGAGPEFSLSWGGRAWRLSFDEPNPGLCCEAGLEQVKLLSLDGLARTGRVDRAAFTPESLVQFELHRGTVRATFAPTGWGGLTALACWRPTVIGEGIDLEIQLSAATVGELDLVVVNIESRHGDLTAGLRMPPTFADGRDTLVTPEDVGQPERSAPLTHPLGRAPTPQETQRPLPGPRVLNPTGTPAGWFYVEMARPSDMASPAEGASGQGESKTGLPGSTRYSLLGHDLEKGVILRARVRGCWINSSGPERAALAAYRDFLREPPSLR